MPDNFDDSRNKNLTAILFMFGFIIVLIVITVVIVNARKKSTATPDTQPSTKVEQQTNTDTPVPTIPPLPFDDLTTTLFEDIKQILSCSDVNYFAALTPGIYKSDLAEARSTLGKCEAMSYSVWYGSDFSTQVLKGNYMLDILLNGANNNYGELLVYFYIREYDGAYSIESVSFDYVKQD